MVNKRFLDSATEECALLPESFFTQVVPQVKNMAELKVILYFFYLLNHKQGYPKCVTHKELLSRCVPAMGEKEFQNGLRLATERGVILSRGLDINGKQENIYFASKESLNEVSTKTIPKLTTQRLNIFVLYEQNIGLITPLIAEELKEAAKLYPTQWIEEAFKEAVTMNKRSWKYISRILERWASEGKDSGEHRQDIKKGGPDKYIKGKYGHLVKR
jgi:DnaD/phage-associated family protein